MHLHGWQPTTERFRMTNSSCPLNGRCIIPPGLPARAGLSPMNGTLELMQAPGLRAPFRIAPIRSRVSGPHGPSVVGDRPDGPGGTDGIVRRARICPGGEPGSDVLIGTGVLGFARRAAVGALPHSSRPRRHHPPVNEVDGDTIYGLGSNTKIFTMLAFLHEAVESYLNNPVSRWVPELADRAAGDPISDTDWDSIALGSLASQMSGLVRDYAHLRELTQEVDFTDHIAIGFPPNVPIQDIPFAASGGPVQGKFMTGITSVPPSFAPSLTAGYSNAGYQLSAYALDATTGRNFTGMTELDIVNALDLSSTYYRNAYGARHTLLSGAATRRWLKPMKPTSDFKAGIGAPWASRRIQIGTGASSNRIIDSYAKAGSINVYQPLFLLIPDYEIGITTLPAGGWPGNTNWDMADTIGPILLPAIEQAAREQAGAMYGGTYASTDGELNITVTFTTDDNRPGLGVQNRISNGTDTSLVMMFFTMPGVNVTNPSIRIHPTGFEARNGDGSRRVAFKAVAEDLDGLSHEDDMFSARCGKQVSRSTVKFASRALDQFLFDIDSSGNVVSVENQALRAKLAKQPRG
ncbi:hypothetical protein DL765_008302 [Monosporascus sp. GIB2]|nr:hypothetical protein DL765_008302 [Monosporascus sp. GIB2]